jgi:maltose O-acetyltransferase
VLLGGIRIGNHAVIGAGSVVLNDVPNHAIAVGNPAKIIRRTL